MKRRTLIAAAALAPVATVLPRIARAGSRVLCHGMVQVFDVRDRLGDLTMSEGIDITPRKLDITASFNGKHVVGRLQDITLIRGIGVPTELYVEALIDEKILTGRMAEVAPLYWALGGMVTRQKFDCKGRPLDRDWKNLSNLEIAVTATPSDPDLQGRVYRL